MMNLLIFLMLTNFLKTIFIIIVIYYGIRFVAKYLFPKLIDKGIKNMQDKIYEQQREAQRQQRRPGDVTIEFTPDGNKSRNTKSGEYVTFEEVE